MWDLPEFSSQPGTAAPKPKGPANKDIYDIFNSGDYSRLDSIVAEDAIDHTPWGTTVGLDSMKAAFAGVKAAFPDLKVEVLDEVVQANMVMTRCRTTGTNTGSADGRPATGKKIDVTGVDVTRLKDGKLYEHWDYSDYITYFKQLGIDPFATSSAKKKEEKK